MADCSVDTQRVSKKDQGFGTLSWLDTFVLNLNMNRGIEHVHAGRKIMCHASTEVNGDNNALEYNHHCLKKLKTIESIRMRQLISIRES